jgi:hypothetical protein
LICVCARAENGITLIATSASHAIKVCFLNIDFVTSIADCEFAKWKIGNSSFSGTYAPKRNADTPAQDRFPFVNIA